MISESTKYLYNRLPEVYRKADINGGNETLLRFLSALDDGGFRTLNLDIEKLYNIMSIEKAPQELIPVIGNMLGYKYVKEVDDRTQRKIVENLVELYKRKGTKSAINFIIREFTEYDTKLIQTEYRTFKTWSPNPQGIPVDEYVEPRTLGSNRSFHPNPNTCYLISDKGKYNGTNIIFYIVDDADENSLVALNNILREFIPVGCKFFIQGIKVNKYTDECILRANDDEDYLRYVYRDDVNLKCSESSKDKTKFKSFEHILKLKGTDKDIFNPNIEDNYFILLNVDETRTKEEVNRKDIDSLVLQLSEKAIDNVKSNTTVSLSATTKDVMVLRLFDEETLPIIGTDSISEEV